MQLLEIEKRNKMIDITIDNIESALRLGHIKINMVYPITKKAHFVIERPIRVHLSNDDYIIIGKGFRFDGSSSPRFLWWALPSYGDFFFAALIHDWLYVNQYLHTYLGSREAQKFADKEMLLWSNKLNNNKLDNKLRYWAVRLFGRKAYLT